MSGRLILATWLGAALMAAWAVLRAIDHFRGRPQPSSLPRYADFEIVVQPWDPRTVTLADNGTLDPTRWTYWRN